MKKILCLLMAAIMVLSMASCGNGGNTESESNTDQTSQEKNTDESSDTAKSNGGALVAEDGAVVRFSYWAGSPSDEEAWNAVIDSFKADHPEITLEAEAYPSENYVNKLDTMVAGGDWPDVMRYTYQKVGRFKEADVMLDLSEYLPKESVNDLIPAYKEAMTYDGKLVGMPHHTDTMGIYYNKAMLEESGVRIPTSVDDAWTWDEMTEIAKKLKHDHSLDSVFGGIWENKNGYRYLPFAYMNGGAIFGEDGTTLNMQTPEFTEAIKLYEDWRADGLASATGFTQETACNMSFVAEKLAFVFAGSWQGSFMNENFADKWGLTYMPQKDGKTSGVMGGNALFAYSETKFPIASAILIDYITNKENMKTFCEVGNFIPVRQSLVDEGLTYESFQEEMNLFSEIVNTVDPKMAVDTTSARFQEINVIFSEEMDKLVIDGRSAEDTITAMEEKMQEVLDE